MCQAFSSYLVVLQTWDAVLDQKSPLPIVSQYRGGGDARLTHAHRVRLSNDWDVIKWCQFGGNKQFTFKKSFLEPKYFQTATLILFKKLCGTKNIFYVLETKPISLRPISIC